MNAFFRLSTILCHMCLHSPVGGRLGCFHILAIANNCAMNMRMQITLRYAVFISFEICPKWNRWIIWSLLLCCYTSELGTIDSIIEDENKGVFTLMWGESSCRERNSGIDTQKVIAVKSPTFTHISSLL